MHTGMKTSNLKHTLMESLVNEKKRYLGVPEENSMKIPTQYVTAMKRANTLLGIIWIDSANKTANIVIQS